MTFNIRNSGANDGANRWAHRRDLWAATVRAFDPHLLGVQEVLPDQYADLQQLFADYGITGVPRDDAINLGERASILFRTDRFDKLAGGDFWLSETPDVIGSKSWDACITRICSWVRLHDRWADRDLLFANTHFDHIGEESRLQSARLLSAKLPALAEGSPIVLTGDFNATEIEAPYAALVEDSGLVDSFRKTHPQPSGREASFHGFTDIMEGHRIDWIFSSADLTPIAAEIVRDRAPDGRWPSDHHAVTATFKI